MAALEKVRAYFSECGTPARHYMCVGAAAAEMAMYEALATVAAMAGDEETEKLARRLQQEEKEDYDKAWALLPLSAKDSSTEVVGLGTKV